MNTTITTPIILEGIPDSEIEKLPLSDLRIDRRYQRVFDQTWVDAKVPEFNVSLLGTITVSKRGDIYWVVDGQHRVELVKQAVGSGALIKAEVFYDLDAQQEARLFLGRNATKRIRPFDRFHAGFAAGEEDVVNIVNILRSLGLDYGNQRETGKVNAVASLRRIYGLERQGEGIGAAALTASLRTAIEAWGKGPDSFEGTVLAGLGLFFREYLGKVDSSVLAEKLAVREGGPRGIKSQARTLRSINGRTVAANAAAVIVGAYNAKRSSGRLLDSF